MSLQNMTNSVKSIKPKILVYGTIMIFLLIFIIAVLYILFPTKIDASSIESKFPQQTIQQTTQDVQTVFIILSFVMALFLIIVLTIPAYKDISRLLTYLSSVFIITAYIILLIVLFRVIPHDTLETYAKYILPTSMLTGFYLFYRAIASKRIESYTNLNFERIKYSLLYFCLIVFILFFYTTDLGGYVTKYFGPFLIITILLLIFGFFYVVTLMTSPSAGIAATGTSYTKGFNILNVSSFILFLIVITYGLVNYPTITENDKMNRSIIIGFTVVIFLIWIPFLILSVFPETFSDTTNSQQTTQLSYYATLFQRIMLILSGLTFSCIIIYWIVGTAQSLTSKSTIGSFILNFIIVLTCLGILFKMITATEFYQKNHIFKLIVNLILYIPCIFVNLIDTIASLFGIGLHSAISLNGKFSLDKTKSLLSSGVSNIKNTNTTYFVLLFIIIITYVLYFAQPYISEYFVKQGGILLINQPIYLTEQHQLANYQSLNHSTDFDYTYAISFWIFLDAQGPNTSSSYNKFTSILNYGGKPNVLYNASTNTLMVTMLNPNGTSGSGDYDADGNNIICSKTDILLQKWHNIIINYNGGTLDVFYNGELIKSTNNVVPLMSYDTLTVGSNGGVNGGICNVNYFRTSLTSGQIYYIYNLVKNTTPPAALTEDTTILQIKEYTAPIISAVKKVVPI